TMRFWEANSRSALLLTEDKDFGELVHRLGRVHAGIVLIRLAGLPPTMKAGIVAKVLQDHAAELQAAFTVISPGRSASESLPVREGAANQSLDLTGAAFCHSVARCRCS